MANSNGWGDGSVNNNIGWGQGANNTIGWGKSQLDSWSGATDIDGGNLPSNSVAPAITGTAQEGQTLTCSTGTWSGSPTYTYQWKRNGSNIGSATNSTYTLVTADVGQSIKCTVTATNFVGSATADSNTVTPISAFTNTKSATFDRVDEYATTTLSLAKSAYPNISLSCWVKMTKTGLATYTDYQPLSVYVQIYPNSSPIRLYTNGTKQVFVAVQGQGGTTYSTTDLSNGSWHHILQTCQYDAGGTICNVYVNGVQEITNKLLLNYTELTGNLNIGSLSGTTWLFKGNVDEISVYSRILNSTERTALYNAGVPNDLTSLSPIAWYRMGDGDTAPTLINYGSTGTSKNATMVNMDNTNFVNDVP